MIGPVAKDPTWTEALCEWEAWCRASGHSEGTIANRRSMLARFAVFAGCDPWSVTLGQMVTFLGRPGWAASTRKAHRQALRSFYAWATSFGHVADDVTVKLPRIRPPAGEPRPAPDDVLAAALGRAESDRDRLVLALAAYAGLRRAEVAALRWDHIGADHVRVLGKGGRVRVVPLHPKLGELLAAERTRRAWGRLGTGFRYGRADSVFVFPGQGEGTHMTPDRVGRIARRLLGGGWSTHTLRHRFATRAYAAERDLLAVQRLLGHSSSETTRVYARVPAGALERAVLAAG